MRMIRRLGKLGRRYGHASMAQVHGVTADLRKLARDNAMVTAGAVGAAAGAVASSMSPGSAALVGMVTGIAAEEIVKK